MCRPPPNLGKSRASGQVYLGSLSQKVKRRFRCLFTPLPNLFVRRAVLAASSGASAAWVLQRTEQCVRTVFFIIM